MLRREARQLTKGKNAKPACAIPLPLEYCAVHVHLCEQITSAFAKGLFTWLLSLLIGSGAALLNSLECCLWGCWAHFQTEMEGPWNTELRHKGCQPAEGVAAPGSGDVPDAALLSSCVWEATRNQRTTAEVRPFLFLLQTRVTWLSLRGTVKPLDSHKHFPQSRCYTWTCRTAGISQIHFVFLSYS